ncbi:uncharacterized protein PRCAT00000028001 [Priceomyces carsonii]|uniref:uncharacterized protein n=1 Tax=Priceomyces carsonii TaxID=28549 RepID=UPI002ED94192|nr:unnamed protein product [Priceomyces carsonii]
MKILKTIIIDSAPDKVRSVFLDLPSHAKWDPFFVLFESETSELKPGSKPKIQLKFKGDSTVRTMTPVVLENNEEKLQWKGTLFLEYLFTGTHTFEFLPHEEDGKESTKFIQTEDFSGVLVYVLKWIGIFGKTEGSFEELNQALKKEVER